MAAKWFGSEANGFGNGNGAGTGTGTGAGIAIGSALTEPDEKPPDEIPPKLPPKLPPELRPPAVAPSKPMALEIHRKKTTIIFQHLFRPSVSDTRPTTKRNNPKPN